MLQAHMNEYPGEINFYMERFQMRPYEYLEKLGVLNENFWRSQSSPFGKRERDPGKARDKSMSLSFQQLWKSSASHAGIVEKGITAALGTDGQLTED